MTDIEKIKKYTGRVMIHPVFGKITITEVRKTKDRWLAYFPNSVCNLVILGEEKK